MRKSFALIFLFLTTTLLAACTVSVDGNINPPPPEISNASYRTDFQAMVDGRNQDVICDDRVTNLTYSFDFDGDLDTWVSYLKGVTSGDIAGRVTLSLTGDNRVSYDRVNDRVTVNYQINAGAAPLAIVVSPKVVGESQLFLQFGNDSVKLLSNPIPVLQSCN